MIALKRLLLTVSKKREHGGGVGGWGRAGGGSANRKHQDLSGGEVGMGNVGQSLYWSPKERIGEAEPAGLGLAGLNNFSGLWAIEDVPRCLVPGPGVIRQVDSGL